MSQPIATQLWFSAPHKVELRQQQLPPLKPDELLIATELSAVSAGTELLVYRGQIPTDIALDATLESLQETAAFPLQYGYASVGRVLDACANVDKQWLGQRVFAFQPHASHFIATPEQLIPVPEDVPASAAVFLANMETAVNLVQDGKPGLGEHVVVLGQGIVGLLLSSILGLHPLAQLTTFDSFQHRRQQSLAMGATSAFAPTSPADIEAARQQHSAKGADLIYEVSGTPDALNLAIELSGFTSRIVIGSWYGNKVAPVALGGSAHRNHLKISTSQVSHIAPELSGRWDKARRFDLAWQLIRKLKPDQLITHSLAIGDAANLYATLDQNSSDILQAVFTYP